MGIRASKPDNQQKDGPAAPPAKSFPAAGQNGGNSAPMSVKSSPQQHDERAFVVASPHFRDGHSVPIRQQQRIQQQQIDLRKQQTGEEDAEMVDDGVLNAHVVSSSVPVFKQSQHVQQQYNKSLGVNISESVSGVGSNSSGSQPSQARSVGSFNPAPLVDTPISQVRDKIPVVFTWKHGGREVYLTGSFNNWREKIPLNLSHGDFTVIQDLPPGEHSFRFLVDGKWQTDPTYPTVAHADGQAVNMTTVATPDPAASVASAAALNRSPVGSYSSDIPTADELVEKAASIARASGSSQTPAAVREPPALPPHLRRALLNTAPLSDRDPSLLPLPHHVMLNHFYSLPRDEEEVIVLGITRRWRGENTQKFVTTVFYKPSPSSAMGPAQTAVMA